RSRTDRLESRASGHSPAWRTGTGQVFRSDRTGGQSNVEGIAMACLQKMERRAFRPGRGGPDRLRQGFGESAVASAKAEGPPLRVLKCALNRLRSCHVYGERTARCPIATAAPKEACRHA